MSDFYGRLTMDVVGENTYISGGTRATFVGKVRWVLRDDTKINQNVWEIDDGDYLEVYDNMGKICFSKRIVRDLDSHYNRGLKKQIYRGTTVSWLPEGVDAGFWFSLFNNRYRARLIKNTEA